MARSAKNTFAVRRQLVTAMEEQFLTIDGVIALADEKHLPICCKKTLSAVMDLEDTEASFYPSTLRNIAVVLGVQLTNQALNEELVRISAELEARVAALEEKLAAAEALAAARSDQLDHAHITIDEHVAQVSSMRDTVKTYQAAIKRKNKLLRALVAVLCSVFFICVLLFAFDMLTPSLGYFRRFL